MHEVRFSAAFRRAYKRLRRSGKFPKEEVDDLIDLLASDERLPQQNRDHALHGEYAGKRECHIRGDLLLVYERHDDILVLVMINIGTHHDIFGT